MVIQDTYSQPDAPDPVLEDELVLELVRRHVPQAQTVTGLDESGGEARAYAVDSAIILKTQRPHRLRPRTSLAKEECFLRHLESKDGVCVPGVLGYGRHDSVEYLCITRMPGVAIQHAHLSETARADALRQLGRMLRRIHAVSQEPFAQSGLFPSDIPEAGLHLRFEGALTHAVALIHGRPEAWPLERRPDDVVAAVLRALPASEERAALHSNPGPEHAFVNPKTGAFSGLIDFGDAYISHPALDLCRWRSAEDRAALIEGYAAEGELAPGFLAAWRASLILTEMTAIARDRQDRTRVEQNLRELVAEL